MDFDVFQALPDYPRASVVLPEVTPPSVRDLDHALAANTEFETNTPMADPCPHCGGFNLTAGDWTYLGCCMPCFTRESQS